MFEISYHDGVCEIVTKRATINIDVARAEVEAGLNVGTIRGAGEFEIGEVTIMGIATAEGVVYTAEDDGVRIGVIGGIEVGLDDLGPIDILVTSSVKAAKEVGPKVVIAADQVEKLAEELKVEAKYEKRLKIKSAASLPATLELYKLG
jgi:hypothetical protein